MVAKRGREVRGRGSGRNGEPIVHYERGKAVGIGNLEYIHLDQLPGA